MSIGAAFTVLIVLIVVIATLRQRLVYEFSGMSLLLFGRTRPGLLFYSIIFLPGTIIHELSHWIVAEILQVKTGEITIFPDTQTDQSTQRLGSVATVRTDPFRGFLIGLAPFITGLGILAILGRLLQLGWGNYAWWQLALIIYGIMVISNSMMISKEDRRTWPFMIVTLILLLIVMYRMQLTLSPSISLLASNTMTKLNMVLGVTAGFNLVMIGGSYLTRRLVERVTKKRIIHK